MQYFGVEAAFPFASNLLHGLSWSLPYAYRQREGMDKPLLRSAFAGLDLPAEIKVRPTFCSKGNLVQSKANLSELADRMAAHLRAGAAPEELRPFAKGNFQWVKLALLQKIFVEGRGELPDDMSLSEAQLAGWKQPAPASSADARGTRHLTTHRNPFHDQRTCHARPPGDS